MSKEYVVGFAFCNNFKSVALIRKNKPKWQAGLLNGVGGKIEEFDKDACVAISREFEEEAGLKIPPHRWSYFLEMKIEGNDPDPDVNKCKIYFFYVDLTANEAMKVQTSTDEVVDFYDLDYLRLGKTVPNIQWLIPMAIDNATNPHTFNKALITYN